MPVDPKQSQPAPHEPTVMVKKADGTLVRVPLSKMGLEAPPQKKVVAEPQPPPQPAKQPPALPAKQEPHALAITAPVTKIFVDEAKYAAVSQHKTKTWKKEDAAPLLEETVEHSAPHTPVSQELDERFQRIMRKMPFPVPAALQERTRSLILSRLKDIRSDEQIVAYATQSPTQGGLGLSQEHAQALVRAIQDGITPPKSVTPPQQARKDLPFVLSPTIEEEVKLMARTSVKRTVKAEGRQPVGDIDIGGKPVIHDVTPITQREKRTMGPVEELHQFSQTDFERLAPTPEMVTMKLVEKFLSLKQESFLLFLEARRAWQESPLYHDYQQAILEALHSGRSLEVSLSEKKKGLTFAGVKAIVSLNKQVL